LAQAFLTQGLLFASAQILPSASGASLLVGQVAWQVEP